MWLYINPICFQFFIFTLISLSFTAKLRQHTFFFPLHYFPVELCLSKKMLLLSMDKILYFDKSAAKGVITFFAGNFFFVMCFHRLPTSILFFYIAVIGFKEAFGNTVQPAFLKNLKFFFLLKFNMVCTFWIVLMC
jgi:hypothetical protein